MCSITKYSEYINRCAHVPCGPAGRQAGGQSVVVDFFLSRCSLSSLTLIHIQKDDELKRITMSFNFLPPRGRPAPRAD